MLSALVGKGVVHVTPEVRRFVFCSPYLMNYKEHKHPAMAARGCSHNFTFKNNTLASANQDERI